MTGVSKEADPTRLVTLEVVKRDPDTRAILGIVEKQLTRSGFTEHGPRHANLVSHVARNVLRKLEYPERTADLAAIAGYLHDIGNVANRKQHAEVGAVMAMDILRRLGMGVEERCVIGAAVGNHAEESGEPVNEVSAAVIIADKSDMHRSRVANPHPATFDHHDRVNYAVEHSFVRVSAAKKIITLEVTADPDMATPADYFELFLDRMLFVRRAATFLGLQFELLMNNNRLL